MYIQSALPFRVSDHASFTSKKMALPILGCVYTNFLHIRLVYRILRTTNAPSKTIHNACCTVFLYLFRLNGMIGYYLPENSCKFNTYSVSFAILFLCCSTHFLPHRNTVPWER